MSRAAKRLFFFSLMFLVACSSTQSTLISSADSGDIESQVEVGINYYFGKNGFEEDKVKGEEYLIIAYEQGSAAAAFNLGSINQKTEKYEIAAKYYKTAADLGDFRGQDNLAILYMQGFGVEKDFIKAEQLLLKALDNGSKISNRLLGILYKEQSNSDKQLQYNLAFLNQDYTGWDKEKIGPLASELMVLYKQKDQQEQAYVWGALATIMGAYDSPARQDERELFEEVTGTLSEDKRKELAKSIVTEHYDLIDRHQYFLKRNEYKQLAPGVYEFANRGDLKFIGYFMHKNKEQVQAINYFKTKDTYDFKVNLAINKIILARSYGDFSALYLQNSLAKSQLEEAISILDPLDNDSLSTLKETTSRKLTILTDIYEYQFAEAKRARNENKKS